MYLQIVCFILVAHGVQSHSSNNQIVLSEKEFSLLLERIKTLEQNDVNNKNSIGSLQEELKVAKDEIADLRKELVVARLSKIEHIQTASDAVIYDSADWTEEKVALDKTDSNKNDETEPKVPVTRLSRRGAVSSPQSEHVRQLNVENPVAFFAVVSPTKLEHVGALQNVVFDKAVTNVGNAYNPHHGVFTAPVTGLYLFSVTILADQDQDVYARFTKNGTIVSHIYAHGTSNAGDWAQGSQTIILELQKGEDISVQNDPSDNTIYGHAYTSLCGVLLAQLFPQTPVAVGK